MPNSRLYLLHNLSNFSFLCNSSDLFSHGQLSYSHYKVLFRFDYGLFFKYTSPWYPLYIGYLTSEAVSSYGVVYTPDTKGITSQNPTTIFYRTATLIFLFRLSRLELSLFGFVFFLYTSLLLLKNSLV